LATLKVIVKSEIKNRLSLSQLIPLQGNLKELPEGSYEKLKASILKHGFIFPFFVWEDPSDAIIYICDGTQRHLCLTRMKKEGYSIPQLPIIFLEAESLDDAKEKLLAVASQFGKFTEVGISDFLGSFNFVPEDMFKGIDIPFLDFGNILESDGTVVDVNAHTRELKNTGREVDLGDFENFEHKCPGCGLEYN